MGRRVLQVSEETHKMNMLFTVVLACFVAAAAAAPSDVVVGYDLDDHEHTQKGEAGTAVTGSYSFTGADGVEHIVNYIADDKGYRVVGDAKIETTARPAPAPTRAPTPAPTAAPTRAPTPAPTRAPVVAKAPVAAAAVHVVPVTYAIPVQFVQAAHVSAEHQNVQYYSTGNFGQCYFAAAGENEVVGPDGTRYTLQKIA